MRLAVVLRRALAGAAFLALAGCPGPIGEVKSLAEDESIAPGFSVEVGCSELELRTPIARIAWRGERAEIAMHRVDLTPFPEGFKRGHFATVMEMVQKPRIEMAPMMKSLETVARRPFEVEARRFEFDEQKHTASLEVARLEPGVIYQFRVAQLSSKGLRGSRIVRVQAPVCITDVMQEEK